MEERIPPRGLKMACVLLMIFGIAIAITNSLIISYYFFSSTHGTVIEKLVRPLGVPEIESGLYEKFGTSGSPLFYILIFVSYLSGLVLGGIFFIGGFFMLRGHKKWFKSTRGYLLMIFIGGAYTLNFFIAVPFGALAAYLFFSKDVKSFFNAPTEDPPSSDSPITTNTPESSPASLPNNKP